MRSIHRQLPVLVVVMVALLATFEAVPAAQAEETVDALSAKAETLYKAGKHAEALVFAERAAAAAENQLAPDHAAMAPLLDNIARLRCRVGQYAVGEARLPPASILRD